MFLLVAWGEAGVDETFIWFICPLFREVPILQFKYMYKVKYHTHLHINSWKRCHNVSHSTEPLWGLMVACVSSAVEKACPHSSVDPRAVLVSMLPCLQDPFLLCTAAQTECEGLTSREPACHTHTHSVHGNLFTCVTMRTHA